MCRRSTARTSMASRCEPTTRSAPSELRPAQRAIATGVAATPGRPRHVRVAAGEAVAIATGGMLPRGADAVVMIEHAESLGERIARSPGRHARLRRQPSPAPISPAAKPCCARARCSPAAKPACWRRIGESRVSRLAAARAWRSFRRATKSSPPGEPMRPAWSTIRTPRFWPTPCANSAASRDSLGIVQRRRRGVASRCCIRRWPNADVVLLSGGTSKGQGDLSYRVVAELRDPGIVAHGVALKPGKPICLAVTRRQTGRDSARLSDLGDFHVSRVRGAGDSHCLAGRPPEAQEAVTATLAVKVNSEIGRTEYLLVGLVQTETRLVGVIRWAKAPAR